MDQLIGLLVMVIIFGIIGLWPMAALPERGLRHREFGALGAILILILLGFLLDRTGLYHFHP